MKVTHTSPVDGADLCELEEGDVVYLNYNPKKEGMPRVSLVANGEVIAETDDILKTYSEGVLYFGKYETGFLPEKTRALLPRPVPRRRGRKIRLRAQNPARLLIHQNRPRTPRPLPGRRVRH